MGRGTEMRKQVNKESSNGYLRLYSGIQRETMIRTETIKKNQTPLPEMKITVFDKEKHIGRINSRIEIAEGKTRNL